MSATQHVTSSIPNTDRLNYLNIGLITISCLVAFFVPFELFLFSYAVLGPLHYLTEISWLHERSYFTGRKKDLILLGISGVLLFLVIYNERLFPQLHLFEHWEKGSSKVSTALVYIAFFASLAMVILKTAFQRFIAFLIICATSILSQNAAVLFSVFLPTLIHVYLFTGFFMLYGALKGRSKSGYLSVVIFFLVPFLFIFITPGIHTITAYSMKVYPSFHNLNIYSLNFWNSSIFQLPPFNTKLEYENMIHNIYYSVPGLIIMRFIAFAYTYHYLNWFSKTTVIKWHNVPKKRLVVIGALWMLSVGFYLYDYQVGFNVLFLLSFLHVFLEFPLNHVTFIGIFKESISILSGKPVAVVKSGRGKKK